MYVDADVFVALTKPNDRHRPWAEKIMSYDETKCTSIVTLIELQFVLQREVDTDAALAFIEEFGNKFPDVQLLALDRQTLNESIQLRKTYGLSILDAIHATVCLQKDRRMASTDGCFDRVPNLRRV